MLDNDLDISIQDQVVSYKHLRHSLLLENYFLVHRWKTEDLSYSLYTETELRKLHRVFGHPSVSALSGLLKGARPEQMTPTVREALEEITQECTTCATYASKPRRFKLTVGSNDLRFNHTVAIDVMYLSGKPVLHAVDEATHFNAAMFLRNQSSQEVWKTLLRCWTRLYLGPPDYLHVDQGTNFVSKEFLSSAEADGIEVTQAPIESPNTMSHVERYHAPLRSAFLKIRDSLPRSDSDSDCLQMAVKAANDTIGPEGLCPTLLVFGSLPRPARRSPADTQVVRAKALEEAMRAVHKEQSARRVSFGLKRHHGPVGKEASSELYKLPSGAQVLVYRQNSQKWEGPFTFIHIDGETVVVQLPSGRRIFRSSVVKPVVRSQFSEQSTISSDCSEIGKPLSEDVQSSKIANEEENVYHAMLGSTSIKVAPAEDQEKFAESRKKELEGLAERGTFATVKRNSIPRGTRIYGTRFVDAYKVVDRNTVLKSRLVAQNFRDLGAAAIATKAPTVSRLGQRLVLCLAACFQQHISYLRDISQAYVQATSNLERAVYLRAPKEMHLEDDEVLMAV